MTSSERRSVLARAVVAGVLSALVFVPVASFALDAYVAVTVSVGDTRLISHLVDAALVTVGLTCFASGFLSSYFTSTRAAKR